MRSQSLVTATLERDAAGSSTRSEALVEQREITDYKSYAIER